MGGADRRIYDRRSVLRAGLGIAAAVAAPFGLGGVGPAFASTPTTKLRVPGSLPFPSLPVGKKTGAFPFDHIVIVMQENHSFDNYLGMLPVRGQPKADGFTFNAAGEPINWNPLDGERMYVFHQQGDCGTQDTGSQSWNDSHLQIDGGTMNGFAGTGPGSMGYWTDEDLPFYYSVANTFILANRWFCSVPAQTFPNRRFLMAGTASGIISTSLDNIDTNYPPNGTIWDRLSTYRIPWLNYWSDAPTTGIMLDTCLRYPENLARIEQFYVDAAAGTLPAVSLVDCNMGQWTGTVGGELQGIPVPALSTTAANVFNDSTESEEEPQDIQLGEAFVARITHAVMSGPAWRSTLMIWLYDEHGGYYDHVAPPAAVLPDNTPPQLSADDLPGGYNLYGPRVPAVVISAYSRAHEVTNVVHDHTSVLATIEQQWNLPALTYRDANATTLIDFLDTTKMTFPEPPPLAAPANPLPGLLAGYQGQPLPPNPSPN